LGTRIDDATLKLFSRIAADLRVIRIEAEKSIKRRLRTEFEHRLRSFEDEIIKPRAAGRTPHTIFAEAILYLQLARQLSRSMRVLDMAGRLSGELISVCCSRFTAIFSSDMWRN
jgi:hypothetical protein